MQKQFRHETVNQVAEGLPGVELPVTFDRPLEEQVEPWPSPELRCHVERQLAEVQTGSYLFSQLKGPGPVVVRSHRSHLRLASQSGSEAQLRQHRATGTQGKEFHNGFWR